VTPKSWAAVAVAAAIVSFGFAMWASTSEEGAPSWRSAASLASAAACVGSLGVALTLAE
jgi:predicted permease